MRKRLFWFLLGVMAVLTGCNPCYTPTAGDTKVVKQSEVSLGGYQVVKVPDLEGSGPEPQWPDPPRVPKSVRRGIADAVAQELKEAKLFARVERESGGSAESVLLVKGRVLKYSPGSRAKRYMGHGGEGSIIVNVKFVEKASGRELAEANFKGVVGVGFFGGSITGIYTEIAQEIVQFIKASF